MAPAVGHRVAVGPQVELVGQAQRAVPVQAQAHLLLAGANVAVVVARGGDPPGLVALALETHPAAADLAAGHQLQLRLARRQATQLVDQLLQFAQVEQLAGPARKAHRQFARAGQRGAVQALQAAFDDDDAQGPGGQVLLWQVGTGGDVAAIQVMVGDGLEQRIELADAQAAPLVGRQQLATRAFAEVPGAFQLDAADLEAALVVAGGIRSGGRSLAGQLLEFLQALALFVQQALLAVADQVAVAGGGEGGGAGHERQAQEDKGQAMESHDFIP
ncbi:hypothetical protein BN889_00074 [Pseudomonas aeruginosa PA38182]|nr:hypothetical protein BN889_00074 [Pseudomonas aeruginosa PA38182]